MSAGPRRPYLVISADSLVQLNAAGPGLAARILASPATLVLSRPGRAPSARSLLRGVVYTSYARFRWDLAHHQIPPGARVVTYDPEAWAATPRAEQDDPGRYLALFAAAAHRHGYATILMPGRDLMLAHGARCRKRAGELLGAAFLRCGLAADAARLSEVFEMQTAPAESPRNCAISPPRAPGRPEPPIPR